MPLSPPSFDWPSRCAAAAAAVEAAPFKGDLFNDSYYPTGADVANVNKRWCVLFVCRQVPGSFAGLVLLTSQLHAAVVRFPALSDHTRPPTGLQGAHRATRPPTHYYEVYVYRPVAHDAGCVTHVCGHTASQSHRPCTRHMCRVFLWLPRCCQQKLTPVKHPISTLKCVQLIVVSPLACHSHPQGAWHQRLMPPLACSSTPTPPPPPPPHPPPGM